MGDFQGHPFRGNQWTVYRGESAGNRGAFGAGRHYTRDWEFARQFTQSGLDREIRTEVIDSADVYAPDTLPFAGDEKAMDAAIAEARARGFKAVMLSEGKDQPESVFVFSRSALRPKSSSWTPARDVTPPSAAKLAEAAALNAPVPYWRKRGKK